MKTPEPKDAIEKEIEEAAKKYVECTHEGVEAQYCICACKEEDCFKEGAREFIKRTEARVWREAVEFLRENDFSAEVTWPLEDEGKRRGYLK